MTDTDHAVPPPPDAALPGPRSPWVPIRAVPLSRPFTWLAHGWQDFRRAPGASLPYGVMFAVMGWFIYLVFHNLVELTTALTAGFLLVGPFLATGLYDISRTLERGEQPLFADTLNAWRTNLGAFSMFALALIVIMLVWARVSLVIFALFFSTGIPTLTGFLGQVVSFEHVDFVLAYFGVGALFATITFAVSVVSVPMMLDRGTDTIVAAITSVRALAANPGPLALWAALIVTLVAAGFATLFVGLIVAVPVIGHATWHAYRDLVGAASDAARPH
jgi:uncharacterized membrane protein